MNLRRVSVAGVMALMLGLAVQIPQESVLAQSTSAEAKSGEKKADNGRVPAYFAQIGLTKEQRAKVIDVQNSYAEKIEALRKQIADLEAKRDADVRGPLTDEQKKKLDELIETGKKKAAESRSKPKATSAESKEGDKKPEGK